MVTARAGRHNVVTNARRRSRRGSMRPMRAVSAVVVAVVALAAGLAGQEPTAGADPAAAHAAARQAAQQRLHRWQQLAQERAPEWHWLDGGAALWFEDPAGGEARFVHVAADGSQHRAASRDALCRCSWCRRRRAGGRAWPRRGLRRSRSATGSSARCACSGSMATGPPQLRRPGAGRGAHTTDLRRPRLARRLRRRRPRRDLRRHGRTRYRHARRGVAHGGDGARRSGARAEARRDVAGA